MLMVLGARGGTSEDCANRGDDCDSSSECCGSMKCVPKIRKGKKPVK